MKTSLKYAALAIVIFVGVTACSKKDDNQIRDCELNNYGVVTFKYSSSSNYAHSVDIYTPKYRRKTLAKGLFQDTVHFAPGTYRLDISAIDNAGIPIQNKQISQTVNPTTCSGETISTEF